MTHETKKCGHPACECQIPDNISYCSTYCESAGDTLEIACGCSHTGCSEPALVDPMVAGLGEPSLA